ncbi:MAG: hypothetical protein RLY21_2115 [Planctomycetota bacterium]|jgi:hypothetical protein
MRTDFRSTVRFHASKNVSNLFSLCSARGVAITLSLAASAAFLTQAAVAAAPTSTPEGTASTALAKKFAPRKPFSKRDPVEALLPKKFRGMGLVPSFDALTGNFVIKFRDEVKARAPISGASLASDAGADLSEARAILAKFGGVTRQWIRKSESELALLESRARDLSGREQPDLAGMIFVSGVPMESIFDATRALNGLGSVEYISIERHHHNLQAGCDPNNPTACERPSGTCTNPFPGDDAIVRTDCNPDPNADPRPFGCNDVTCCEQVGDLDPTCVDENDTGGWDVYCAAWANLVCAGTVYDPAPDTGPYDPCFSFELPAPDPVALETFDPVYDQFQNANCVTPHSGRGCNQPACCNSVCLVDPTCCSDAWDSTCANLVLSGQFSSCVIPEPDNDVSPDLALQETAQGLQGFQYYTQGGPRPAQLFDLQGVGETWAGAIGGGELGFSGHGFALKEMEDFQNLIWEFYQGGDPLDNPYLGGGGVRVGILETSGTVFHEDFILAGPAKNPQRPWEGPLLAVPRIIQEPGVSPVFAEQGSISTNHGTNVMGVLLAADNGFGVTGMAPNAQGYFFPIISAESGFRAQDAITSAFSEFTQGDVLNFSWGFQGAIPYFPDPDTPTATVQPVTSSEAYSTLIALGTDLGITSVVAAGSGATEIQGSSDEDVGAIIVTASWPGNFLNGTSPMPGYACCEQDLTAENLVYIRYPGSNYEGESATAADETADATAWGFGVVTTGASTSFNNTTVPNPETFLFQGTNDQPPSTIAPGLQVDRLRLYTQTFGGTSAAAAMVSGIVARMQGAARQFYGTPITPIQARTVIATTPSAYFQCPFATGDERDLPFREGPPFSADSCATPACTQTECLPIGCACTFHPIGPIPNLQQLPATLLSVDLFGGNTSTVEVITGGQLAGYAWNSFQIKVADENYLRIVAQPRTAGDVAKGLTYMSTGRTTDVRVVKEVTLPNPEESVNSLNLQLVSRATRNFVICGAFIFNNDTGRYEFFGAQFLTTQTQPITFNLPQLSAYGPYLSTDNTIDMRVWTCGLGATGRHTVDHDLIDIGVNVPLNPL